MRSREMAKCVLAFSLLLICFGPLPVRAQVVNEGLRTNIGRWMDIPDNPTIALPVFTAETWVKCYSGGLLVTRDHPTGTPSDWQLWYESARNRLAFITATSPPDTYYYTADNSFLPNRWYHVALVVNGPAGTAKLYVNGTLLIAPTFSTRDFSANTGLAWGGYYNNSSGAYLNGFFDEARYWSVERTPAQIMSTKDIALPMNDRSGLKGYWRFCGNYADSSGNGNHGTPRGGVTIEPIPDLPFGINCVLCSTALSIAIAPADTALCEGGSALLTASSGFVEYLWSTGARTRTISVSTAGRYSVTVRDALGCVGYAEVLVTAHPAPVVDAGRDTAVCASGSAVLIGSPASGGTPPYRYAWSPPTGLDFSDVAQPKASPAVSTLYRVQVTDANGCITEDYIRVDVAPELWLDLPDSLTICTGTSVVLPLVVVGGTPPFTVAWTPPDYLSSSSEQVPLASPPATQWYRVVVRDAAGCIAEDSIRVVVADGLDISAIGGGRSCSGDSVQLGVNVSKGTPPYRYNWRPPTGLSATDIASPIAFPSGSRTYIVRVIDSAGCSAEDTVTLTVSPPLLLSLPDSVFVCSGDSVRLPLLVSGGDGRYKIRWRSSAFLSDLEIQQPIAFPPTEMLFRVVVIDSSGCVAEDSVRVSYTPAPELLLPDTLKICTGTSVQLPLVVNRAAPPLRYVWTPAANLSDPTVRQPIASPSKPTMYRVRVEDGLGCWSEDSVFVAFFPVTTISLTAEGPTRFCDGDSVKLSATPGYAQYRWLLPSSQRSTASNQTVVTAEGGYRVAVTDSNGCEALSNIVFITRPEPFPIQVIANGVIPLCAGDSVTLGTAAGFRDYVWRNESGTVIGRGSQIKVGGAGRYFVTARDSLGCEGKGEILVTQAEKPKPTIDGPLIVCINSTQRYISMLKPGYSYSWRAETGSISDAGRGSTVTINWTTLGIQRLTLRQTIDSSGCSDSLTILVRVVDRLEPKITGGPLVVCEGDSVLLKSDVGYASWVWKDDSGRTVSTQSEVAVRRSGRYIVDVKSADGCSGSDTIDVVVVPRPVVSIQGPRVFCEGDTAEYTVTSGGDRLRWTVSGGELLDADTAATVRVFWKVPASGRLRVTVERNGQPIRCPGEDEILISVGTVSQPWVMVQPDSILCEGDSAEMTAQPGFSEYRWRKADGTVVGSAQRLRVTETGLYYVTVRDSLGCEGSSVMVSIVVKARPATEFTGPRTVCVNAVAEYCVMRDPTSRYRWEVEGGEPLGTLDGPCIQVRWPAPGTWKVKLFINDDPCDWVDSAEVVVGDSLKPDLTAQGPFTRCEGDTLILDAGAGYATYEWSTPDGPINARTLPALRPGRYSVRVTDANGCGGSSDPIDIIFNPAPRPIITGPGALCIGDSVILRVQGNYRLYRWSDGSTGAATTVFGAGVFQVEVVDSNGCVGISDPFPVAYYPVPDKPVISRKADSLVSTPAFRYQWHMNGEEMAGAEEQTSLIRGPGSYVVRVWNEFGCAAESDPFIVVAEEVTVMLPELVAAPGDLVRIPLTLIHGGQLASTGAGAFEATIRVDRMVLKLLDASAAVVEGRGLLIPVTGRHDPGQTQLASLDFIATLGDTAMTSLTIEAFRWLEADINTRLIHGSLRLLLCEEGGERLFSAAGAQRLKQNHPNPFNAQTVIEYQLIERGHVSLYVLDALGRRVAALEEGEKAAGEYRALFDATSLPSGTYLCVLRTPSTVLYRRMLVIK